jgi:hypothetical protein
VGPDPLRINHHVLTVDVVEFESAVERGALDEAVRVYRGPFLEGFYLNGAEGASAGLWKCGGGWWRPTR